MQLHFVNVSGAEPWKNKEAKKFVRSHAMKDFRRRQRESAAKHLMGKSSHCYPLETCEHAEMATPIPAFDTNDGVDGCKSGEGNGVVSATAREPATDISVLVCDIRSSTDHHEPRFQIQQMLNVDSACHQTLAMSDNRSTSRRLRSTLIHSTQPSSRFNVQLAGFDSSFVDVQIAQECFHLPTVQISASEVQGRQNALQISKQASLSPQWPLTFQTRLSILADTVFNAVEGGVGNIVTNYLKTTHTWLCMIHERRFLDHLTKPGAMLDAEFTIGFLAMYLVSPASTDFRDGKCDNTFLDGVYRSVKELYHMRAAQRSHFMMVISGIWIALYEIYHTDNAAARITLRIAATMAYKLGLDSSINYTMSSHQNGTLSLEERRRVWWSLVIVDRCVERFLSSPSFTPKSLTVIDLQH